jgi:xylan 1,4-beta-xylosidase
VRLERLGLAGDVRVTHWRIDGAHSNSHAAWRGLGAPQDPSAAELTAIRERQGLERLGPDRIETVRGGALTLRIALPLPAVSLIELRPAGARPATP